LGAGDDGGGGIGAGEAADGDDDTFWGRGGGVGEGDLIEIDGGKRQSKFIAELEARVVAIPVGRETLRVPAKPDQSPVIAE
jgi:hypothetical protein